MIDHITSSDLLTHPRSGQTELFFVRHGQTAGNKNHQFIGSTDIPLDELGMAQALQVAERFRDISLDAILTSPLQRAKYTAERIGEVAGVGVQVREGLREIDFGDAEGLTIAEILDRHADLLPELADLSDLTMQWPGGEQRGAFHERILATINDILDAHEHERVAVVCHGGVIGSVMAHLEDGPRNDFIRYRVANCSITHLVVTPDHTLIHSWNDHDHLDEVMGGFEVPEEFDKQPSTQEQATS